jgi:hypothetical protein
MYWLLPALVLAASAAGAQDANWNGLDDSLEGGGYSPGHPDGLVAIVDTGDYSIGHYQDRLDTAGYTHALIPLDSGYSTLSLYDAVILPTSHASGWCYDTFDANAADYIQYVNDGGCLHVGQPNPHDMDPPTPITWVPYELGLSAWYNDDDCPPVIVDPDHCMSEGLQDADLPFPADWAEVLAADWNVINEGAVTGYPGLLTAPYGAGHVLVDLAHPSPTAGCPFTDAGFARMMMCCLGPPIPVEDTSWGHVKTIYR